jgi:hypothetical protein
MLSGDKKRSNRVLLSALSEGTKTVPLKVGCREDRLESDQGASPIQLRCWLLMQVVVELDGLRAPCAYLHSCNERRRQAVRP